MNQGDTWVHEEPMVGLEPKYRPNVSGNRTCYEVEYSRTIPV